MKLTIMGPQGCGKGTQAELLSKEFNIPTFSTGDLLRKEKNKESELGKEIAELIDRGEFVSPELIAEIVKKNIENNESYILDGFPRNLEQVKLAEEKDIKFDKAIYLTISDETVIKRLSGRQTCKNCGSVYHLEFKKPKVEGKCDSCEGELYTREDDTEEAIKRRLEIYKKETEPVIGHYKEKGILAEIDGEREINEIQEDLRKLYKESNL
jgi:adenylate kinase